MSAFGPKQTWAIAPHTSAFGGKADMTGCRCPLSRSLLGVKRTSSVALHMSANDPKRTSLAAPHTSAFGGKADMARSARICDCIVPYCEKVESHVEENFYSWGCRTSSLADRRVGPARNGATVGVAGGNLCLEYGTHSEAGILPASGASPKTRLLEASSLCPRLRQARDEWAISQDF